MSLPSGYTEILDNTTLDADEINGYLQQGVLIFDDESDRDNQLSGVLRDGMVAYTKNDNTIRVFDGDGWLATDNPLITTPKTGAVSVSLDRYAYWTFTSSGSFVVQRGGFVDILAVGGGGAGANTSALIEACGGGGGGAVVDARTVYVAPGTYSIVIGAGGSRPSQYDSSGRNGSPSLFGTAVVAPGGGGGGGAQADIGTDSSTGFSGGSGGGGGGLGGRAAGGTGISGFGNNGGAGRITATVAGGGGGGAGAVGVAGASAVGGDGGDGDIKNYPPAAIASTYYGGGGGGGVALGGTAGSGGQGGGGAGGAGAAGTAGTANTGGGGGGAGGATTQFGGNGGSGIVIVRMKYL